MRTFKYFFRYISLKLVFSLFTVTVSQFAAGTPDTSFRVQERWDLGGDGGWDHLAVDDQYHRLYVTRSNRVTVVDTATGKTVGEITGLKNVHSVCLDNSGKYGFIIDGASGIVRVFDRSTLETTGSIPAGKNPDAAVVDQQTGMLWVFNARSKNATVIDPAFSNQIGEVSFKGEPTAAVGDGNGAVFVTLEDTHQIVRIDTKLRQLTAEWSVPSCSGLTGLAIDVTKQRLYSVCDLSKLMMLDSASGRVLGSAGLAAGTREITYDPKRELILAPNGGGTLSILKNDDTGSLSLLQTVKTQTGATALSFDAASSRIYLPAAQFGMRTGVVSEELRFRPTPVAGSFVVLVVAE